MKIQVTDEDIKGATRGNSSNCPVARAVKRITGRGGVAVGIDTICIYEPGEAGERYALPRDIVGRIFRFDMGGAMEPFEFEFEFEMEEE